MAQTYMYIYLYLYIDIDILSAHMHINACARVCAQPWPEVTDKGSWLVFFWDFFFFPVLTASVWAQKCLTQTQTHPHTHTYTRCYTMALCGGCVGPFLSFHSLVLSIVSMGRFPPPLFSQ